MGMNPGVCNGEAGTEPSEPWHSFAFLLNLQLKLPQSYCIRTFSLSHHILSGPEAYSISYPMGTRGPFPNFNVAAA
jgi:hypothetical protein